LLRAASLILRWHSVGLLCSHRKGIAALRGVELMLPRRSNAVVGHRGGAEQKKGEVLKTMRRQRPYLSTYIRGTIK
jgi:hypothetical protein